LGAYERLADPNALLLIKDFVHLVCRALAACSFHVTPVEEILNNGRSRYHELLLSNAVKQVSCPCLCCAACETVDQLTLQFLVIITEVLLPAFLPQQSVSRFSFKLAISTAFLVIR
jgi:hypothetical protein